MQTTILQACSAVLPLLVAAACGTSTRTLPRGTYMTTVQREELAPALGEHAAQATTAEWELRLTDEGAFEVRTGNATVVHGRFAVAGDTVTFTDASGSAACAGHGPGVFTWRAESDGLVLKQVEDDCPARALILTIHPLRRRS